MVSADPALSSLARKRRSWSALVYQSHASSSFSSLVTGAAAAGTAGLARRLIGHLLAPVNTDAGVGAKAQIRARFLLAVVAEHSMCEQPERGWRFFRPVVGNLWAAERCGVSGPAAGQTVLALVKLGALGTGRALSSGGARSYSVPRLTLELAAIADRYPGAIDALATNRIEAELVAEVVMLAAHCAWTHGGDPLGTRAWIAALSDAAGPDLGHRLCSPATLRGGRKDLNTLIRSTGSFSLREALEIHAQRTGAYAARQAQVDTNAATRVIHGHDREAALILGAASHREGAVPAVDRGPEALTAWAKAVRFQLEGSTIEDLVRIQFETILTRRIVRVGHPTERAERASDFICLAFDAAEDEWAAVA
jgi:hypothetical protein